MNQGAGQKTQLIRPIRGAMSSMRDEECCRLPANRGRFVIRFDNQDTGNRRRTNRATEQILDGAGYELHKDYWEKIAAAIVV